MEYPFKDLMPLDEVLEREGYYKDWTHLDPEVFYSLTQISEYIKTKGYGVDVRLLIAQLAEHFGLKTTQVVDLANSLSTKHDALKAQFDEVIRDATSGADWGGEIVLARGGKPTLGARIDDVTAQLAQTEQQLPKFKRIQVETLGEIHSSGYTYTAFISAVNFAGKEIYASRSANDHYTSVDKSQWGKIMFYIREESGAFESMAAPLDYVNADGEYRDPNLSVSKDGEFLFLSCASNDGAGNFGGFMWVFDKSLNLVSTRIQILPYGTRFVWGNILHTPSGKLIKTAYRTQKDGSGLFGIDVYRTTTPVYDDFSTIVFERVNFINYSSWQRLTETTISYWQNKLIFVSRVNGENSVYYESYSLEGDGYIGNRKFINGQLHSPVMQQYNNEDYLLIGGSLYTGANNLRQPAIMYVGNNMELSTPVVIDELVDEYSGYPTLIKSRYGYGIMYYEENPAGNLSSLWFKDINPIAFFPSLNNMELSNRLPFDYEKNVYLDNELFNGTIFVPKNVFKSDDSALDIIIIPDKDMTIYGICTYLRSNDSTAQTTLFQVRNASGLLRTGTSQEVTNLSTERPKLYSYTCTGLGLAKGESYRLRINGNVTAFSNDINDGQNLFQIGNTGCLYESSEGGGVSSQTDVIPVGLIVEF